MVQAVSKNKLADWYQKTAIQQIRAVDLAALTSKRYWEKWIGSLRRIYAGWPSVL